MNRSGLATILLLLVATTAAADERLPVETVFAGNMVLPWAKDLETHEAGDVEALAKTGLWSQLPLATRHGFERGDAVVVPRMVAVVARERAVRVVSLTRRDDGTLVLVYGVASERDAGARNVHLVAVPSRGKLLLQNGGSTARGREATTGIAGRLAGEGPGRDGEDRIEVCHSYDCAARESIDLPDSAWGEVDALFSTPSRDAAQERDRIARAIGLLEVAVGPLAGTSADEGGWAGNANGAGSAGQQDCLDESANTTTYLGLMLRRGLIRFHRPEATQRRGFFATHFSASMRDLQSGVVYVVDSWFRDNGQPAVIQTLADWKAKKKPAEPRRVVINRPLGD